MAGPMTYEPGIEMFSNVRAAASTTPLAGWVWSRRWWAKYLSAGYIATVIPTKPAPRNASRRVKRVWLRRAVSTAAGVVATCAARDEATNAMNMQARIPRRARATRLMTHSFASGSMIEVQRTLLESSVTKGKRGEHEQCERGRRQ